LQDYGFRPKGNQVHPDRGIRSPVESLCVISALLMWRRLTRTVRYALREEDFGPVLSAGAFLIATGTIAYSLGNGWNVVDSLYFAVATLTTSSIADPHLVLQDAWMKIFSVFYILIGIGILVEIARRFGTSFIEVRNQEKSGGESTAPD
jgi:hypothetical protein